MVTQYLDTTLRNTVVTHGFVGAYFYGVDILVDKCAFTARAYRIGQALKVDLIRQTKAEYYIALCQSDKVA